MLLGQHNSPTTVEDIAYCVTGIYCGDNKRFMKIADENVRGGKGYPLIKEEEISDNQELTGVEDPTRRYIPIVKGASSSKYIREETSWFIDWSKEAIAFYNKPKGKARFQNSQFYFKRGIALPMVKSTKIAATLMDQMVFDQSIVGVFPKEEKYLLFLLAFLNSDIARILIHTINPTANSSSKYISKISFKVPTEQDLAYVNEKTQMIITHTERKEEEEFLQKQEELNDFFQSMYL